MFKLPKEVWIGKESYKLDANAMKCYFIGYDSNMFGYKFLDVKNKKKNWAYNVTFDKNVMYKDKDKKGSRTTNQLGVEVELQNN